MSENLLKHRFLTQFLPQAGQKKLVVLTGARQTGKTTLVKLRYPELLYINLDAPENREKLRNLSTSSWSQTIGNAIIDEAQKEPVVFEKVKYAYDQAGISFSLLLGSSQILLLKKIRESLAGRVSLYELWPLLISELLWNSNSSSVPLPLVDRLCSRESLDAIFSSVPSLLLEESDGRLRDAENYLLQWGGMPALLPLSDNDRWKWLRDYEYTYLERDLSDLARLDDLQPFRTFQKLSALRSGKLLNYSEIARDAALSVDTARRYLEYLRLSYQVLLLQPYGKNLTSRVVKTPKLYWLDIGLLRQLSGMRSQLSGEMYETMVVTELYKWIKTTQCDSDLFFYRTRSGLELDIIMQTEQGIVGIEVKARKKIIASDISAMKEVAQALGREWRGGIVLYQGDEIKKISGPAIWAVPSRRLFT